MTVVKGLIVDGVKVWDKGIHRRLLAEATAPTCFIHVTPIQPHLPSTQGLQQLHVIDARKVPNYR